MSELTRRTPLSCQAVETLIACRRLLKNTYPFAYFAKVSNIKQIFEDLQGRLESVTEHLSGLLEAKGEGSPDKPGIINTAADARVRLRNMREMLEASPSEPADWK